MELGKLEPPKQAPKQGLPKKKCHLGLWTKTGEDNETVLKVTQPCDNHKMYLAATNLPYEWWHRKCINADPTTMIFGLCTCKRGISETVGDQLPTVPLIRISLNVVFSSPKICVRQPPSVLPILPTKKVQYIMGLLVFHTRQSIRLAVVKIVSNKKLAEKRMILHFCCKAGQRMYNMYCKHFHTGLLWIKKVMILVHKHKAGPSV